jgi:hypothetical protein
MPLDARHKYCLTCGCILHRLTEGRCPECGRTFDPNDSTSYRIYAGSAWTSGTPLLGALACVHILILAVSTFDVGFRIPGERYPLGATAFDSIGKLAAFTSPVVLLACMLTKRRALLWLGWVDLLLAIVWVASLLRLLAHL